MKRIYTSPPNKKWTNDQLAIEALKYTTSKDFKTKSKHAYFCAQKRKILKDISKHMVLLGSRYRRQIYSFEFSDKSVYVGLTYQPEIRKTKHFNDPNSQVYIHIKKTNITPNFQILSDFLSPTVASLMEKQIIEQYRNKGFNVLNKSNAGELGGNEYKWSTDKIKLEASKYLSLKEFYTFSRNAYDAAIRRGIIGTIKQQF